MKKIPNNFLQELTKNGRQIDAIITYQENGNTVTLDSDEIIAIKPMKKTQLLKSLMKECDIETANPIPKDTQINIKIGLLINHEYKYINLGNFIIYNEPEYNADTLSYTIKAYDKMLYSMVDYKDMEVTYPISVRDFINKICQKIGLIFKNANDEFANYDKMILVDSYTGYDYKVRDVLDELAQVTASIICINDETDELEIRYPNQTNLTLNEDYLKDVNVEIKEKFGPINTITLSRGAEADNVYLDDLSSVIANGVCEIKIKDNQIMNFNDRSDYLPDILNKLKGLEYYIIDIESTGIMILDIYDLFKFIIWEEEYNCLLLNDELNIQDGISEIIYNEIPEETETDYSKADKTDRKINQVYIIADKANKKIESVVSEIGDRTDKKTTITQDIDTINSVIQNTVDITREVTGTELVLENCMEGDLLEWHIYGNNTVFDYLLPSDSLFPSDTLFPRGDSRIKITRQIEDEEGNITEVSEIIDLGIKEVLRQKEEVYDEYVLLNNKAKIIRRIGVLDNGELYILPREQIQELGDFSIHLNKGTNKIEIMNYVANMMADFVIINEFTSKFATTVELYSAITQLANAIRLEVKQKVGNDEIIARINMAILGKDDTDVPEDIEKSIIEILANKIAIKSDNFELTKNGVIKALAGIIAGLNMTTNNNGDSYLYKNYKVGDKTYQSGLFIPKEGNGSSVFLYAGLDITNDLNYLSNANMIIRHDGLVKAKWFEVNGESGSFFVKYNNGNIAMSFTKDNIKKFLENGNTWVIEGIGYINNVPNSHTTWLYDAQSWGINGGEQHNNEELFRVYRRGNNNEAPVSYFWTNLFVNGSQIGSSVSDKRLKKNIKDCKKSALEKIRQFKIKSFKWRKGKNPYEDAEESVDFGIIAQEAEEVDKNSIIHNKKHDSWQMNDLNLICTNIKAIQELDEENQILKEQVRTQQKIMDFLINKLDCQNELKEYMKGEKA